MMSFIQLKVPNANEMTCFVAEPPDKARAAIIVIQEAFGVTTHVKELTKRFSELGYFAIAPEMYHRTAAQGSTWAYDKFPELMPHLTALTEDGMIADIQACYDWLSTEKNLTSVGATGYCMGGRAAFLANSKVPLRAAVSYYGSGIMKKHSHLVAKQISPLLFFWGGKDANISSDEINSLKDALSAANKLFTNIVISDADHGFFTDDKSSYNPRASQLAWATTLEFFKMNLLS